MEPEGTPQTAVKWVRNIGKKFQYSAPIRLVLTELAMFIQFDQNPCPSIKDIADTTGYAKTTVQKAIQMLEADGVIIRQHNAGIAVKGGITSHFTLVGFAFNMPVVERKPEPAPTYHRGEYVYLLKTEAGHYKIGCTTDPAKRMQTFATTLPIRAEYMCLIRCEDRLKTERELHIRFASKRRQGEWFDLSPEDIAYIKSLAVQS